MEALLFLWFNDLIIDNVMGRQEGAVIIRGKVYGLQFCLNSDGSPGVKRARTVSKNAVKKGKNYARTRENMSEFQGSVAAASALQFAFGERVRLFSDRVMFSRLVKKTYRLIQKGPGNKGERKLEVQTNMVDLVGLELNNGSKLSTNFKAPYTLTVNTDRNSATLDVPQFNTSLLLTAPMGATEFSLVLVAGVMSDFTHDPDRKEYAADHGTLSKKSVLAESALMPVTGMTTALQLVAALPGAPVLPAGTTLLVSLGVQYYLTVNNQALPLASGNGMAVVGAY